MRYGRPAHGKIKHGENVAVPSFPVCFFLCFMARNFRGPFFKSSMGTWVDIKIGPWDDSSFQCNHPFKSEQGKISELSKNLARFP